MRFSFKALLAFLAIFAALILLHLPLLRLPYFWDEAGYYIPAALDFYRSWVLIPNLYRPRLAPLRVFGMGSPRRHDADRGGNGHVGLYLGASHYQP
jgi:hypothetical protein